MRDLVDLLRGRIRDLIVSRGLGGERVEVRAHPLSPEEAIGDPGSLEFPLARGEERMVEATVLGAKGQAFTGHPWEFSGTLGEVLELDASDLRLRAILVATSNALVRALSLADRTVHCRDEDPWRCAERLAEWVSGLYVERVALIGYQPAMARSLARTLGRARLRITDMNPRNVGKRVEGVEVEPHSSDGEAVQWADLALVTSSVVANGTLDELISAPSEKIVLYGVTGASAEALLGFRRWCPLGR